jgi:hypothetical protein
VCVSPGLKYLFPVKTVSLLTEFVGMYLHYSDHPILGTSRHDVIRQCDHGFDRGGMSVEFQISLE